MFASFDILCDGNIEHNVIVTSLEELIDVADGRNIRFDGYMTSEDYESENNQIALGNRD